MAPEVQKAFHAALDAFYIGFGEAEDKIKAGRAANDMAASQAGGRSMRNAFFEFDAALRKIGFPAEVRSGVDALFSSLGVAIAAFDAQNAATDRDSFLAVDARTGPAVKAVIHDLFELNQKLGGPKVTSTTTSQTSTTDARVTVPITQPALSRPYMKGATITDAKAWRDDLFAVAKANVNDKASFRGFYSISLGLIEAWEGAFPSLGEDQFVKERTEAPSSGVSYSIPNSVNDKEPSSASNPVVSAFAVKDASGTCAAGVLYGPDVPTTPKVVNLPAGSACTGQAALDAAIKAGFG